MLRRWPSRDPVPERRPATRHGSRRDRLELRLPLPGWGGPARVRDRPWCRSTGDSHHPAYSCGADARTERSDCGRRSIPWADPARRATHRRQRRRRPAAERGSRRRAVHPAPGHRRAGQPPGAHDRLPRRRRTGLSIQPEWQYWRDRAAYPPLLHALLPRACVRDDQPRRGRTDPGDGLPLRRARRVGALRRDLCTRHARIGPHGAFGPARGHRRARSAHRRAAERR